MKADDDLLALIENFRDHKIGARAFCDDYIRLWMVNGDAKRERIKELIEIWPKRYDLELSDLYRHKKITENEFNRRATELYGYDWFLSGALDAIHSSCDRFEFPSDTDSLNEGQLRAEIEKYLAEYRSASQHDHEIRLPILRIFNTPGASTRPCPDPHKMNTLPEVPLSDHLRSFAAKKEMQFQLSEYHDVPVATLSWDGPQTYNVIKVYKPSKPCLHVSGSQYSPVKLIRAFNRKSLGFETGVIEPIEWDALQDFLQGLTERLNKTKMGPGEKFPLD